MKKSKIAMLVLSCSLLLGGFTGLQGNVNSNRSTKRLAESEKAAIKAQSTKAQLSYSFTEPTGNFHKVKSNLTDWSGTYVIGYEYTNLDDFLFDGSLSKLDGAANYVTKSKNNDTIVASNVKQYTFTISAVTGGYSIKSKSGYYIGCETDTDGVDYSDSNAYVNSINLNADGSVDIVGSGGAYLRYDASGSGQRNFKYFSSSTYTSYKSICLYKLDDKFSFTNMKMNVGAIIHKDLISALTTAESSVTEYGVALARKSKIESDSEVSSITAALFAGDKAYVSKKSNLLSEKPFTYTDSTGTDDTGDYVVFSIDLNYPVGTSKYTEVVDAVAYLVVDGKYVVLQEKSCSVASLADEYIANASFFNTLSVKVQNSIKALGALND